MNDFVTFRIVYIVVQNRFTCVYFHSSSEREREREREREMRLIVQRVLRGAVRVAKKGTIGKIDRGTYSR